MAVGGVLLRSTLLCVRFIEFWASIAILGIFSYVLGELVHQGAHVDNWIRAVEGISGAAALYTLFALILVCFLGGFIVFAFLGIILDICFIGAFIAVAILTKGGDYSCSSFKNVYQLGNGNVGFGNTSLNYAPSLYRACELEKATFVLAIILAVLFVISAVLDLLLGRHHQKEKRNGTEIQTWHHRGRQPNTPVVATRKNRSLFNRNKKSPNDAEYRVADPMRPSHDTHMTDNTMVAESRASPNTINNQGYAFDSTRPGPTYEPYQKATHNSNF